MDKRWMELPRYSREYLAGVERFLDFGFEKVGMVTGKIPCPCKNCVNGRYQIHATVREHLICDGFMIGYTNWVHQGEDEIFMDDHIDDVHDEPSQPEDDHRMLDMVNDIFRDHDVESSVEATKYQKYMAEANQPLYPGCETETVLSFIVWLFNHKIFSKWSDVSFDGLLRKFKSSFPIFANLPDTFYEMKKMVGNLGFGYEKIDACENDCILFSRENEKLESCTVCKAAGWKQTEMVIPEKAQRDTNAKRKKVAVKQLRYLPLIPRLQRLFMSIEPTKYMTWHHVKRRKNGVNRHPADSAAWKHLDTTYPTFSQEHRNVRLGLSTDGMSPFTHGSPYSIWPVTVVVYNLPPWMCMKHDYVIMPFLILGPNSLCNDIDVYLRPLIEELKVLWSNGVETYDASTGRKFQMHAALLWTISDFPALAMLSGWSIKGKLVCPSCQMSTRSCRLQSKECYIGHRCFLELGHTYRFDSRRFNGECDHSEAPVAPSGFDILEQVNAINVTFGKTPTSTRTIPHDSKHWRKKSIFFELPYWKILLLRHNLDGMHIVKNICDTLIGTLLSVQGKTKDNLKARLDLMEMGIRRELHPRPVQASDLKYLLPAATYSMSKKEKT